MKRISIACVCLIFTLILPVFSEYQFQLVDQWKFGERPFGEVWDMLIDKEGHVVAGFRGNLPLLFTPKETTTIASFGQGPSQITNLLCYIDLGDKIGLLETSTKLQVYAKKGNQYSWKENLWFKQAYYPFSIKDGIFYDKKYFFAGWGIYEQNNQVTKCYNVKAFQENGQPIKTLIHGEMKSKERKQVQFMKYFIGAFNGLVYYMPEHDLTVTVISAKDVAVVKTVKLAKPAFYKPLPDDFYSYESVKGEQNELTLNIEKWMVSYSLITNMVLENGNIVIQTRTCDPKLKKFCLLFYDVNTFKLVNQVFMDDYFLGARNGKYYCLMGGDPALDEIDDCVIHIYEFKQKKGK